MVKMEGIRKHYGRSEVLKDITCTIPSGTIAGIVGKNGTGKTTLLSILAGVLPSDGGSLFLYGKDAFSSTKIQEKYCSYVPQENPLMADVTVLDNMKVLLAGKDWKQKMEAGVKKYGLESVLHKKVSTLSGGMKRRVSIALAAAENQAVLLLDEPTASLDFPGREEIHKLLFEHKKSGGIVILTTHETEEMKLCDLLFSLKDGQLIKIPEKTENIENYM